MKEQVRRDKERNWDSLEQDAEVNFKLKKEFESSFSFIFWNTEKLIQGYINQSPESTMDTHCSFIGTKHLQVISELLSQNDAGFSSMEQSVLKKPSRSPQDPQDPQDLEHLALESIGGTWRTKASRGS